MAVKPKKSPTYVPATSFHQTTERLMFSITSNVRRKRGGREACANLGAGLPPLAAVLATTVSMSRRSGSIEEMTASVYRTNGIRTPMCPGLG
ncbi:hypothetical protein ABXV15_14205 [Exiguobacterium profundum]|uniref:hypothetical protein n=1 Tax=Exiguobacterium profundum TaxID=307643 RepID=UPI0033980464